MWLIPRICPSEVGMKRHWLLLPSPFLGLLIPFPFLWETGILYHLAFGQVWDCVLQVMWGYIRLGYIIFFPPLKTNLMWSYGRYFVIFVRDGSGTVISGANISQPLSGKRDFFLYISHMLPFLDSNRAYGASFYHHCLLPCPWVLQVPSIIGIFPLIK